MAALGQAARRAGRMVAAVAVALTGLSAAARTGPAPPLPGPRAPSATLPGQSTARRSVGVALEASQRAGGDWEGSPAGYRWVERRWTLHWRWEVQVGRGADVPAALQPAVPTGQAGWEARQSWRFAVWASLHRLERLQQWPGEGDGQDGTIRETGVELGPVRLSLSRLVRRPDAAALAEWGLAAWVQLPQAGTGGQVFPSVAGAYSVVKDPLLLGCAGELIAAGSGAPQVRASATVRYLAHPSIALSWSAQAESTGPDPLLRVRLRWGLLWEVNEAVSAEVALAHGFGSGQWLSLEVAAVVHRVP